MLGGVGISPGRFSAMSCLGDITDFHLIKYSRMDNFDIVVFLFCHCKEHEQLSQNLFVGWLRLKPVD